jgi:hypothetical protein
MNEGPTSIDGPPAGPEVAHGGWEYVRETENWIRRPLTAPWTALQTARGPMPPRAFVRFSI